MPKTAHRQRLEEANKAKAAVRAELLAEIDAASLKPNAAGNLAGLGVPTAAKTTKVTSEG